MVRRSSEPAQSEGRPEENSERAVHALKQWTAPIREDSAGAPGETGAQTGQSAPSHPSAPKWSTRILSGGIALCAALVIWLGIFQFLVFSDAFHSFEHERLETGKRFTRAAPGETTRELQAYFRRDGLQPIDHPLFSYRERMHFLEIKRLIRNMQVAAVGGIVALVALGLGLGFAARKATIRPRALASMFCLYLSATLGLIVAAHGVLAISFDRSFLRVHTLLFNSKNWLLPPESVTVQLFPMQYFRDFFLAQTVVTLGIAVLSLSLGQSLRRRGGQQRKG